MAKVTGIGDNFYLGGFDLSGDTASLSNLHGGTASQQDVTDITQAGVSRLGLERDGGLDFVVFHDPPGAHVPLSALPVADVVASYFRGTVAGNPAASVNSKQVNYDPTRGQDGSLTLAVSCVANGFGLEWGTQLTPGKRTDSAATAGPFFDNGAAFAFGAQAYFQVFAFTGTSAVIDIQHATTSGGTYSSTGLTTTSITTAPQAQRLAVSNSTTINEFLKVVTTGTFSNLVFAVMINVNNIAGVTF